MVTDEDVDVSGVIDAPVMSFLTVNVVLEVTDITVECVAGDVLVNVAVLTESWIIKIK